MWPTGEPARTSALLYVMGGLGFEEATARQALVRAADSGWITSHKHGREVSWSLSPYLVGVFERDSQRVLDLSGAFSDWDYRWVVLFITVPQAQRSQRKRLYSDLTWAGFGNPAPGVWLSPHGERRGQVSRVVDRLGLAESTMSFYGPVGGVGLTETEIVAKGWDLESLAQDYRQVYAEFWDPVPSSDDDLLFTDIRAIGQLQRFPFTDPQLPEALLPDWIGRTVASHIKSLRTEWAGAVRDRWAAINRGPC
ncbi:PaaX family transcriptional regulator C-terminal domain-containing protein [Citricoccus parietis]|uniref:PaaX family transcriptional regulator C-terminal domain-containing protein n=1 Tax=Citricoccus parietis TaxID=592307 RepID=A0ABV5G4H9_9MICC